MKRPLTVLGDSRGKHVIASLRGGREYRGVLDGYDPHMNLVLRDAEEYIHGEKKRDVPLVIVRGDNVIFVSP